MHSTWLILRWASTGIVIAYCVLYIIASGRLSSREAKRSTNRLFYLVVALAAIRELFWFILGGGLLYRLADVFVGAAAGIAGLALTKLAIKQKADSREAENSEERIRSLKLN